MTNERLQEVYQKLLRLGMSARYGLTWEVVVETATSDPQAISTQGNGVARPRERTHWSFNGVRVSADDARDLITMHALRWFRFEQHVELEDMFEAIDADAAGAAQGVEATESVEATDAVQTSEATETIKPTESDEAIKDV